MSDTLPNVPLVAGVWTDLYAATGITVGVQLLIQNLGSNTVYLHSDAVEPIAADGFKILPPTIEAVNKAGDAGAWALSNIVDTIINVAAN